MADLFHTAQMQIDAALEGAFARAVQAGQLTEDGRPQIEIEIPNDLDHGDFSSNFAMKMAKAQKKAPRQIAEILLSHLDTADTYIEKVEIAGPGFINFYLKRAWLLDVIPEICKNGDEYGRIDLGAGQRVNVEFVSANPTGPMHMGNARGGALGDCLAAVLDFAGYDVTREFYMNDAGKQIEKFATSLDARYLQIVLGENKVSFPEEGYHGEDIKERAHEFYEIHGDAYKDVDDETRKKALTEYALPLNMAQIKSDMTKYRILYDIWFMESDLYKNGEVDETLELLKKSGHTYEKEGALWFKTTDFGCEKDDVLVRNTGIPTYFAADIAYHRNKLVKRNFATAIDIWGADHHGHIARLKAGLEALGIDSNRLEIIIMQLVRLVRGNEVVRMSKRSGKAITLTDLLDETSIDAARFFFNLRQANSHFDFDLDLAIEQSNENPVYYVQYAHARVCSILRLTESDGVKLRDYKEVDLSLLKEPEELTLLRHLLMLPAEIAQAAKLREPSRMTRYVTDLATHFHSFYNACRVRCEEEELMQARLLLCKCVKNVMKNVLTLLGIDAPEQM